LSISFFSKPTGFLSRLKIEKINDIANSINSIIKVQIIAIQKITLYFWATAGSGRRLLMIRNEVKGISKK
jgi:hypothetical protein